MLRAVNDGRVEKIGVIDLGSNTARLVILEAVQGYAYRMADTIREVVRLREGMTDQGLSASAIERGLSALKLFKRFSDSVGVDTLLAVATSAVRDAANRETFIQQVWREVGLKLHVLDGEREAYYGALGALNEVPVVDGMVVDIGGGSAQVSLVQGRAFQRGASRVLGALALTEQFVHHDPIKTSEYKAIKAEIARQLDTLDWLTPIKGELIGLGGTIRNLAWIEAMRQDYPFEHLHGFCLAYDSIDETIDLLRALSLKKRRDIPGLNNDRADIILPGAMVIRAIMGRLEADEVTISVNGLREGLFFEWFWKDLSPPVIPDVRRFSVLNMARVYDYQETHVNQVRYLAGRLFDQLAGLHGYGDTERELLDSAAMLHDLGTIIDYENHHRHTEMLIAHRGLRGFTPRETAIIALLTRYHRRGTPKITPYKDLLRKGDRTLVRQLSAILRLAEYLERGRNSNVHDVDVGWSDDTLHLTLIADEYPAVEMWQTGYKAIPLIERVFKREVEMDAAAPGGEHTLPLG